MSSCLPAPNTAAAVPWAIKSNSQECYSRCPLGILRLIIQAERRQFEQPMGSMFTDSALCVCLYAVSSSQGIKCLSHSYTMEWQQAAHAVRKPNKHFPSSSRGQCDIVLTYVLIKIGLFLTKLSDKNSVLFLPTANYFCFTKQSASLVER